MATLLLEIVMSNSANADGTGSVSCDASPNYGVGGGAYVYLDSCGDDCDIVLENIPDPEGIWVDVDSGGNVQDCEPLYTSSGGFSWSVYTDGREIPDDFKVSVSASGSFPWGELDIGGQGASYSETTTSTSGSVSWSVTPYDTPDPDPNVPVDPPDPIIPPVDVEEAPIVWTGPATDIGVNFGTITGSLTSNGNLETLVGFTWYPTEKINESDEVWLDGFYSSGDEFSYNLKDLTEKDITYIAIASNSEGVA
ncbi:hypothetical protein ACFL6U_32165, partial [Planctomycetota bacterium]